MVSSRTGLTPHLRFRKAVLTRDRKAGVTHCPIPGCGVELDYGVSRQPNSAEPDHIIPAAQATTLGWTVWQLNAPSNGRTICRRCNQSIGDGSDPKPATKTKVKPSAGW